MKVRFQKTDPAAKLPCYAHNGDAGMDVFSLGDHTIQPEERAVIDTGVKIAVPDGYAGLVWDKSGIATNSGVKTIAGVVDSTYRGNLNIALINLGTEPYHVTAGDKIAQLLIQPVEQAEIEEVEELEDTERGEGGFGSTGKQ